MLAFAFLAGCGTSPVDDPEPTPEPEPKEDNTLNEMSLLEAFTTQFNDGCSMTDLRIRKTGKWEIDFSDKRTRVFSDTDVDVFECSVLEWPALTIEGGVWYIDGESTEVPYDVSSDNVSIVAVIYDGEGLYVRLSSGKMFFFHKGRVLDIGCFRFEKALNPSLREDVVCTVAAGAISGSFSDRAAANLIVTVGYRGDNLTYKDQELFSSVTSIKYADANTKPVQLLTKSGNREFTFEFKKVTSNIPKLYITTENGRAIPWPDKTFINATLRIEDPDLKYGNVASQTIPMEIRGRGNSTWGNPDFVKKPYKMKFTEKARILGMSESRQWVLLANYSDKSLLRNALAFKLSEMAGLPWTPKWRPVEVYLNGDYRGLYQLAEEIRVGSERLEMDVVAPSASSGDAITGGYFLRIDNRPLERGESPTFRTSKGMPVSFLSPEAEEITTAQVNYIKNYVITAESLVYGSPYADYSQWIDVRSFIYYFFINELAKNQDGRLDLSTYMWKPYMGKLGIACIWDFDIAFGNCDYHGSGSNGYTGWWIRDARWFEAMFKSQTFVNQVTAEWNEFYPKLPEAEAEIREWAYELENAINRNYVKFPTLNRQVWPNVVVLGNYQAELDYMLGFFENRAAWMNARIQAGDHRKY